MGKKYIDPIAAKEKAIERFRKTTEDYVYNSIKRCSLSAQKQMDKMKCSSHGRLDYIQSYRGYA